MLDGNSLEDLSEALFKKHGIEISDAKDYSADDNPYLWKDAWSLSPQIHDPIEMAASFYTLQWLKLQLEPLVSSVWNDHSEEVIKNAGKRLNLNDEQIATRIVDGEKKHRDSVTPEYKLHRDVTRYLDIWCEDNEFWISRFIAMVCGGELRHHNDCKGENALSYVKTTAWLLWLGYQEIVGVEPSWEKALEMFKSDDWETGYGGDNWAAGIELLMKWNEYLLSKDNRANSRIFIDRVFNLEHNGGSYFSKLEDFWAKNEHGLSIDDLSLKILPMHSGDDPDIDGLAYHSNENVKQFMHRFDNLSLV